jgi:hypothetical protein
MKNAVLFDSGLAVISEGNGDFIFELGGQSARVPSASIGPLFTLVEPKCGVTVTNAYSAYTEDGDPAEVFVTRHEQHICVEVNGSTALIGHEESLGLRATLFGSYSYASGFHIDTPPEPQALQEVEEVEHA